LTNGFIGDSDATFGRQFFDFTETEAETVVKPDGMTDNFGRKAMALVGGYRVFHQASLPNTG